MEEHIKLNFATIEKALWNATLETLQRSLVEILSILDKYLMAKRNKSRYEYKERKEKTPITMLYEGTLKEAIAGLDSILFTTEQTEELVAMSAGSVSGFYLIIA